jgi:antitoxin component YwqK of YwqJK toxin-antitoxin module
MYAPEENREYKYNIRRDTNSKHGKCTICCKSKLKEIIHFRNGQKHGYYAQFDKDEYLVRERWYAFDKIHGSEITYYSETTTNKKIGEYEHGNCIKSQVFNEDGTLCNMTHYSFNYTRHGRLIKYKNGALICSIDYKNGKLDGEQIINHRDSNVLRFRSMYQDNLRHGKCQEYDSMGILHSECDFVYGIAHGNYTIYYANGKIGQNAVYVNGSQTEYVSYYENGFEQYKYSLDKDGKMHGYCATYYADGTVCSKGSIVNGKKHGMFQAFGLDGTLLAKARYHNGALTYTEGVAKDIVKFPELVVAKQGYLLTYGKVPDYVGIL